jgi:hypothetical protein
LRRDDLCTQATASCRIERSRHIEDWMPPHWS